MLYMHMATCTSKPTTIAIVGQAHIHQLLEPHLSIDNFTCGLLVLNIAVVWLILSSINSNGFQFDSYVISTNNRTETHSM
jgi:hypothetical protein